MAQARARGKSEAASEAGERRTPEDSQRTEGAAPVALGVILTVAALVRFHRLDFDLPEVPYVDAFKFVGQAAGLARTHTWEPTHFQYPGLYVYVLVAVYRLFGLTSTYAQHLVATALSASFGVGLVAATAWTARTVCGSMGAVLAATLVALSPIAVNQARMPTPDTASAFFFVLAVTLPIARPRSRYVWLASPRALPPVRSGRVASRYRSSSPLRWRWHGSREAQPCSFEPLRRQHCPPLSCSR